MSMVVFLKILLGHNHNNPRIFSIEMGEILKVLKLRVKMVVTLMSYKRHNHNNPRIFSIEMGER